MVAVRTQTLSEFEEELIGYQARMPRCEGASLDAAMVEEWTCRKCDSQVEYRPFVKYDRNGNMVSYRAFAVCRNKACGLVEEF